MDTAYRVQYLNEAVYISDSANVLRESRNRTYQPSVICKQKGRLRIATGLDQEGKLWIHISCKRGVIGSDGLFRSKTHSMSSTPTPQSVGEVIELPTKSDLTWSHYIVLGALMNRPTRGRHINTKSLWHSSFREPQLPCNKLSPVKQVLSCGKAFRDLTINLHKPIRRESQVIPSLIFIKGAVSERFITLRESFEFSTCFRLLTGIIEKILYGYYNRKKQLNESVWIFLTVLTNGFTYFNNAENDNDSS